MMTAEPAGVTGGVDTHADVHVAAAVCSTSHRLLGVAEFETTPVGYVATYDWLASFGPIDAVGIEGTGSYGAGLARFLAERGVELVEVTRPDRQARRAQGKSDPVDAEAAARAVLSGRETGSPKHRNGLIEAIRLHLLVYDAVVRERTAMRNRLHAVVTSAPAQIRQEVDQISESARILTLSRWRVRAGDDVVAVACRQVLRELARHIHSLDEQADAARARLDELTGEAAPAVRDMHGVGAVTAAQLLTAVGDNPDRIRSEAALAKLCGVAPLQASSGKTHRHRLNRGGNRTANHALWRIGMVRRNSEPRTQAYFERRRAEGRSDREIMRCVKRFIVRELYQALTRPTAAVPTGTQLRELRHQAGLTQQQLADQLDVTPRTISRIEHGQLRTPDLRHRIHDLLTPANIPQLAA